jgi:hypothetical protein
MKRIKKGSPAGSPNSKAIRTVGQQTTKTTHRTAYSPIVGGGSVGTSRSGNAKINQRNSPMPVRVMRKLSVMNLDALIVA